MDVWVFLSIAVQITRVNVETGHQCKSFGGGGGGTDRSNISQRFIPILLLMSPYKHRPAELTTKG